MSSENRPLLADDDSDDGLGGNEQAAAAGAGAPFFARLTAEPLTALSRLLLFVAVALLLLASVFIGLFAGAEHRISDLKNEPPKTVTRYETTTRVVSTTAIEMTTTTKTRTVTTTSIVVPPSPTHKPEPKVCTTSECVILAASILDGMNPSADPCDNFYEYSNGAWIENHPPPSGKSRYGGFNALQDSNNLVVERILSSNEPPENHFDKQLIMKLKDYYTSCTDEETLDHIGAKPLEDVVQKIRELFPVRSSASTPKGQKDQTVLTTSSEGGGPTFAHELTSVLAFLHSIDVPALFNVYLDGDWGKDPNEMVLWGDQGSTGLPAKDYYDDEDSLAEYSLALKDLLYFFDVGSDSESATTAKTEGIWPPWPFPPEEPPKENKTERAERLSKAVLDFDTKLARFGADPDVLFGDPIAVYNRLPLSNLTRHTSSFMSFPLYLSSFTPRNFPSHIILTYPSYFSSLSALIQSTPSSTIQAYLIARASLKLAPLLGTGTEPWRIVTELGQVLNGVKKGTPVDRSKWCLGMMQGDLGFAAGRFFVGEVFAPSARQKAFDLISNIIGSFNDGLGSLDWMDKHDQKAAAKKASSLYVKVGYPLNSPNTTNPASVASYYNLVKPSPDGFFGNYLAARKSDNFKQFLQLGAKRNKESWLMYPSQVNAYYEPPANEIVFPAGILRAPFFDENWPDYMAYGAIGAVVAHELTHAFDSSGRLFNQDGKLEEWWSNSTSEAFDEKASCLAKQYSSYKVDDGKGGYVHVNGNLTSTENIGDSGLIHAYRAWKSSSLSSNSYRLPGLEKFSPEQLFFLAFGRIWAQSQLPGGLVQGVRTDPHSPPEFRVHGTVSNMPEFARAWNCSSKAKLNPKDRCMFWG